MTDKKYLSGQFQKSMSLRYGEKPILSFLHHLQDIWDNVFHIILTFIIREIHNANKLTEYI